MSQSIFLEVPSTHTVAVAACTRQVEDFFESFSPTYISYYINVDPDKRG